MRFMRLPEVKQAVGLSRSQIYKLIQEGRFPAPIRVTANVSAWVDSEVAEWQRAVLSRRHTGGSGSFISQTSPHL